MNVKTLCLGYLSLQDATGYEIKKDAEEGLFSHFIEASYGSIYPALSQLAQEGLVTFREEEQAGKPDKKVYSITDAGRSALRRSLATLPTRDKYKSEFLFVMLLQQELPLAQRIAAIEKQLSDLREELARIASCRASAEGPPGCEFVMGYGEAVLYAGATYLESKLAELQGSSILAAE